MHVIVTGGTGFIGHRMVLRLLEREARVTAIGTRPHYALEPRKDLHYLRADVTRKGDWQNAVKDADVVINLVGKTIFHRWTDEYKAQIRDSRVLSTQCLVESLPKNRPALLINASGVGFYGNQGEAILSEDAPSGDDFLAAVGEAWESAAMEAEKQGHRVLCTRFGVVLGEGGGAVEKMLTPFRYFMGGPIGSGKQWFPWIHMKDLIDAALWVVEKSELSGPVNFCSPEPVRNAEMSKTIGRILGRPAFIKTPAWAIRMAMGELSSALLSSQRCVPAKLLASGFSFTYPDMDSALRDILKK